MEEDGGGFRWTGAAGLGPDTSLGRIVIAEGRLRLECNSRARLARGKKLIEDAAGKSIRYRKDEYETAASAMARLAPRGGEKPEPRLPPEVERELIRKVHDQHYAAWPDKPLPALGGRTPRQAVQTGEGRASVLRLIHDFENAEARPDRAGAAAYDFSKLREELGLGQE
jgi:hypothetical protein